jgi:glycosyltransferase involved in cell wall biosynthesis
VTAPKINVYPADMGGCGWYRIMWPAGALIAQGANVEIILPHDADEHQVRTTIWTNDDGTRIMLAVDEPDCDVAVLQRPLTDTLANAIPLLQAKGVKVVVEIDDDFENISPRNVSWANVQPSKHSQRNYLHLRRACEAADLVVVSTQALADIYGRHGRVAIVPNCVPEAYLWGMGSSSDTVRIGWSGSTDTHPDDLQVTRGAVQRVIRQTGAEFHVVGTGKGVQSRLGLAEPPKACGWQPIDLYPSVMADIDVGIVPLEPTRFNEAKSWLKGLEFAALGVPFVASPTGPYMELLVRGAGLVANRPKDWDHLLKRLVLNEGERQEMAEAGREVAATLTVEGNCDRWWDAWSSAVNTRSAMSAA